MRAVERHHGRRMASVSAWLEGCSVVRFVGIARALLVAARKWRPSRARPRLGRPMATVRPPRSCIAPRRARRWATNQWRQPSSTRLASAFCSRDVDRRQRPCDLGDAKTIGDLAPRVTRYQCLARLTRMARPAASVDGRCCCCTWTGHHVRCGACSLFHTLYGRRSDASHAHFVYGHSCVCVLPVG